MKKKGIYYFLGVVLALVSSCGNNSHDVDLEGIEVSFDVDRFEKDLFSKGTEITTTDIESLRKKYGSFADIFFFNMIRLPEGTDSSVAAGLNMFVNDAEIRDVARLSDSVFTDVSEIKEGIDGFYRHHKYYFPERHLPGVVTYISAFNYAVITTDSVIGIGLDMFLGPTINYYPRMGIPKYMFSRFSREYIVPSVVKAWFQSDYDISMVKNELLSQMIYQGKQLYYMKAMLPEMHDSLLTGFTGEQLKWCEGNETEMWSFFIENKLLFSTDQAAYSKYINDGPTTNGFPKESPAKIGAWIGWRIVNTYMQKSKNINLTDLLRERDAQKILEVSGYKPEK